MALGSARYFWVPSRIYVWLFLRSDMLELEFVRVIMFIRRVESTILELGHDMLNTYAWMKSNGNFGLRLLWYIMHMLLNMWYFALSIVNTIESLLISTGFFKKYRALDISKVQYLAIVIDSEEARNTLKVLELLRWLTSMGLKNVCLYDAEGVLKKSKEALSLWLNSEMTSTEMTSEQGPDQNRVNLEVISFADGKHAIVKASNFLFKKHYLNSIDENLNLSESDMTDALSAIGYGAPEPDLMLVYGPVRCHLGFPAWRIRYTEIVHMGPLGSMKLGSLIKAIYRFTMVHQNYGT